MISRNLVDGSSVFGPRASGIETVGGVVHGLAVTARTWVLGGSSVAAALGWVVLVAVAALVLLGVAAAPRDREGAAPLPDTASLLPLVALVVGYVAYLAVSELVTNINAIDSRLLSPVYAPTVVLFALALDHLLAGGVSAQRRWVAVCLAAMVGVWLLASLGQSVARAHHDADDGQGYTASSSVDSQFVAAFRLVPRGARVYSNYADGLYAVTGREPVFDSPAVLAYRSTQAVDELAAFRQQVRRSRTAVYLVWLTANARTYLLTPELLAIAGLQLRVTSRRADTTVYAVRG